MSKSEFVAVLRENGLDTAEENGVVIVFYEGGLHEFKRTCAKARYLAVENGYVNSLGVRAK